jgi:hypothetical protein
VNTIAAVGEDRMPILCSSFSRSTPGVAAGTKMHEIPDAPSPPVRANT